MKTITLTMKEQKRVEVIQRVFREELRMTEAGRVLGVSERQTFRIKARVKKGGPKGSFTVIEGAAVSGNLRSRRRSG